MIYDVIYIYNRYNRYIIDMIIDIIYLIYNTYNRYDLPILQLPAFGCSSRQADTFTNSKAAHTCHPHRVRRDTRSVFQLLHAAAAWEAWRHVIPNWRQLSVSCPCQRWVGASTSCRCSQMFSGFL